MMGKMNFIDSETELLYNSLNILPLGRREEDLQCLKKPKNYYDHVSDGDVVIDGVDYYGAMWRARDWDGEKNALITVDLESKRNIDRLHNGKKFRAPIDGFYAFFMVLFLAPALSVPLHSLLFNDRTEHPRVAFIVTSLLLGLFFATVFTRELINSSVNGENSGSKSFITYYSYGSEECGRVVSELNKLCRGGDNPRYENLISDVIEADRRFSEYRIELEEKVKSDVAVERATVASSLVEGSLHGRR